MKLDEAIEILDRHFNLHFDAPRIELDEAAKLGIEALKRLAFNRLNTIATSDELLPGETEN